jgi:hypothetical protein
MFPFLGVFNFGNAFFHTKKSVNRDLFSLSTPFTCIFNKPDRNQILQARLDRFLISSVASASAGMDGKAQRSAPHMSAIQVRTAFAEDFLS